MVDLAVAGGADPVRADLGLVGRTPGYVVIAERREAPVAGAGEADGGRRRLAGVGVMVNGRRQYVHAECVSADWPRAGHDLCGHSVVSSAGGPWSSRAVAGASQASISRGSRAHVLTAPAGHDGGLEADPEPDQGGHASGCAPPFVSVLASRIRRTLARSASVAGLMPRSIAHAPSLRGRLLGVLQAMLPINLQRRYPVGQ